MAQTTKVTRVFPLAILASLGGICFPANHQVPGMVHSHPAIQLLPHAVPHPACPSWREARQPTRLERIIHWQRSKCCFMVTQSGRFLIHCAQPGHLPWPGVGGSGWGHQGPWACASPTPPWVCARDPKDPTAAVLRQSKGWIPPGTPLHLLPCLEHPHLAYPVPPAPQHCPCQILTQAGVPSDPPPRQRGSSHPQGKAFGKYFPWRSAPWGNISPADGI